MLNFETQKLLLRPVPVATHAKYSRFLVPKSTAFARFETRIPKYWVKGPLGMALGLSSLSPSRASVVDVAVSAARAFGELDIRQTPEQPGTSLGCC